VEMQGDSFHFAFTDPCEAVLAFYATTLQPNASSRFDTRRHENRVRTSSGGTRRHASTRNDTSRHEGSSTWSRIRISSKTASEADDSPWVARDLGGGGRVLWRGEAAVRRGGVGRFPRRCVARCGGSESCGDRPLPHCLMSRPLDRTLSLSADSHVGPIACEEKEESHALSHQTDARTS
jgi:hypothetical protein